MVVYLDCNSRKAAKRLADETAILHTRIAMLMVKSIPFSEFSKGKPYTRIGNTATRWVKMIADPYRQHLGGRIIKLNIEDTAKDVTGVVLDRISAQCGKAFDKITTEERPGKLNYPTFFTNRQKLEFLTYLKSFHEAMDAPLKESIDVEVANVTRFNKR